MNKTHPLFHQLKLIPLIWLAFALYLYQLGGLSLWLDEATSSRIATADWNSFWNIILIDTVHPPGYYLLLRASVSQFANSEFALRLPSALIGVLAVPLIYVLGHPFSIKTALVATLLMTINPFWLWYTHEARMYTLSAHLMLVIMVIFLRLLKRPRWYLWVGFVVASSLAYFSHFFTLFAALIQFVYLVTHLRHYTRLFRFWVVAQGIAVIPLIIWIYLVSRQDAVSLGLGWIPKPHLMAFLNTLRHFSLGDGPQAPVLSYTILILSGIALIIGLFFLIRNRPQSRRTSRISDKFWQTREASGGLPPDPPNISATPQYSFYIMWLLIPPLFTWLVSLRRPIYFDRFFIIILPVYLLIISIGLTQLRPRILRNVAIGLLALSTAFTSYQLLTHPAVTKDDWRSAAAYVKQHSLENDLVVFTRYEDVVPFNHYNQLRWSVLLLEEMPQNIEQLSQKQDRFWIVAHPYYFDTQLPAPIALANEQPNTSLQIWLGSHQDEVVDKQIFPGVQVALFKRTGSEND